MSQQDDGAAREHEPTPRKLQEARRKGEVPKSNDLTTAAAYLGLLLAGLAVGGSALRRMGESGMVLLQQSDRLAPLVASGATAPLGRFVLHLMPALAPWLVVPALAVVTALLAQQALVFAPEKLKPKASRISLLSNAKNKFGRNGLFEFGKSFVKLLVIGAALWIFLLARLPEIIATLYLEPGMVVAQMMQLVAGFLLLVVLIMATIGGVDFFWQRFEHLRKNRMTHKEMRDEIKHSEGDPHIKQQRRQRGVDIATNRMLAEVPTADVVVVNPTHYAVALKWDRSRPSAPVCVAKGVDIVAARIRECAAEAGVPLHRDPPTARAIHATVDLGAEIRPEHYRPVAAAIRFAERMRTRAGKSYGQRR